MSDTGAFNAEQFNNLFGQTLEVGGEALTKLGQASGLYIQQKLRENAFCRKILPPKVVTEKECQRRIEDEGLEYIDDLEPDSIAMHINWRGEPEKTYIQAPRYKIVFHTISSDKIVKSEQELRSYRMPLTKVLEQNIAKDIQEQEDFTFMQHVKSGLFLGTRYNYNKLVQRGVITATPTRNFADQAEFMRFLFQRDKGAGAWAPIPTANLNRSDAIFSNIILSDEDDWNRVVLKDLVKIPAARQQKARTFLLHEVTWTDTVAWSLTEAGLEITSEIVRDGYKYTTVGGYTFVTTIRDNENLVEPGVIYVFPAPEFIGRFMVLENTKFFIDKRGRWIEMEAWEDVGAGFGNIRALGAILLKGARMTLPVTFQNPAGATTAAGNFTIINDNLQAALPAVV
jgi:hypothetical protein